MVIAYLLEVNPTENSGIIKKVNDQVSYWRKLGHKVHVLLNWPKEGGKKNLYIEGSLMASEFVKSLPSGFTKNYLNKVLYAKRLEKKLARLEPDILYLRQNTWYPGLTSILKSHRVVLELNSVDFVEVTFYSILKRKVYMFGREKILRHTDGLVAVTPDILKHYVKYSYMEAQVVSNGIDLDRIQRIKITKPNRTELIFVGSSNMEWHGLKRVFDLAKLLPEFIFNVVGSKKESYPEAPSNVIFHGWVDSSELSEMYARNHIGIGSFSNHLVGKSIDSTLKVREYLGYGLPVIAGHWDVDFMNSEFFRKVTDNNGNFLETDEIREIIMELSRCIVSKEQIRHINSAIKEQERIRFFEQVISRCNIRSLQSVN